MSETSFDNSRFIDFLWETSPRGRDSYGFHNKVQVAFVMQDGKVWSWRVDLKNGGKVLSWAATQEGAQRQAMCRYLQEPPKDHIEP